MARRKELKNIASGIFGSFISRNNDVAGYWGIGQLSLLAQQHSVSIVRIDILAGFITPSSPLFSKLVSGYARILNGHLTSRNIHSAWVRSAEIELNFRPELPSKPVPVTTWGSLFRLTVAIIDDRGVKHEVNSYGYCSPHNPMKERRSAGSERF